MGGCYMPFSDMQKLHNIRGGQKLTISTLWIKSSSAFVLAVVVFLFSGCATTMPKVSSSSMRNPDFVGRKYSRLLIVADGAALKTQKELEENLIKHLKSKAPNLFVIAATESIFPPLSPEKLSDLVAKHNLDGMIILSVINHKASQALNSFDGDIHTSHALSVSLEANLIDSKSEKRAWTDQLSLTVGASDIPQIFPSFAKTIAENLISADILSPNEMPAEPVRSFP